MIRHSSKGCAYLVEKYTLKCAVEKKSVVRVNLNSWHLTILRTVSLWWILRRRRIQQRDLFPWCSAKIGFWCWGFGVIFLHLPKPMCVNGLSSRLAMMAVSLPKTNSCEADGVGFLQKVWSRNPWSRPVVDARPDGCFGFMVIPSGPILYLVFWVMWSLWLSHFGPKAVGEEPRFLRSFGERGFSSYVPVHHMKKAASFLTSIFWWLIHVLFWLLLGQLNNTWHCNFLDLEQPQYLHD